MKDPHNHRTVGYGMIMVAASLTVIALLYLAIGEDVLYADSIQRANTAHFEYCKDNNFGPEGCERFEVFVKWEECVANQDLESRECYLFRTYVESAIFEECRANKDIQSPQCQKYIDNIPTESEI